MVVWFWPRCWPREVGGGGGGCVLLTCPGGAWEPLRAQPRWRPLGLTGCWAGGGGAGFDTGGGIDTGGFTALAARARALALRERAARAR